jgi:hypothetical protein
MEMRKLHMGTMSYGADSMDEVAHQLALAFGASGENGECHSFVRGVNEGMLMSSHQDNYVKRLYQRESSSPLVVAEICLPE